MADELDQLEEGVGRRVIDSLGRVWNPNLHPRDRLGRFVNVFKRIMAMPVGTSRSLNDVVDDAPNISVANIFRTQRGFEVRAMTRSGPAGFGTTVEQMAEDPHVIEDGLQALNDVDPFPEVSKCPHCGAPSPGGGYLPGHEAAERLAAMRRGIEMPDNPVGVRQGLKNLRAMFADPEIRGDIRDMGRTMAATESPRGLDAYRQLKGKKKKIPKVDNASLKKAIGNALRQEANQYIFWDQEQEAFTVQPKFLFYGENLNERGQMLLRGTVDPRGNFKSWNEDRAWKRPDEPNSEELVDNWIFNPQQKRGSGRQPEQAPERVTEKPLNLDRVNAELEAQQLVKREAESLLSSLNPTGDPDTPAQRAERESLVDKINKSREKIGQLEKTKSSLERGEVPEDAPVNITDLSALNSEIERLEAENQDLASSPDTNQNKIRQNDVVLTGLKAQIDEAPDMPSEEVRDMVSTVLSADEEDQRKMISAQPEGVREQFSRELPSIASAREERRIRELMDEIEPPLDGGAGGPDDEIAVVAPIQKKKNYGTAAGLENFFLNDIFDAGELLDQHNARIKALEDAVNSRLLLRQDAKRRLDALDEFDIRPSDDVYERIGREYERAIEQHLDAQQRLREAVNSKREAQIISDNDADREFYDVPLEEIRKFEERAKNQADQAARVTKADFNEFYLRVTGRLPDPDATWSFDDMADFVDLRDDNGDLINVADDESNPEEFARDFLEQIYDAGWKGRVHGKARLAIGIAEGAETRIAQARSRVVSAAKAGKRRRARGNITWRNPNGRLQRARAEDLEWTLDPTARLTVVEDRIVSDPGGKSDGVWTSNDGFFVVVDFRQRLAEEADRFGVREGGDPFVLFEKGKGARWNRVNADAVERRRPLTSFEKNQLQQEIGSLEKELQTAEGDEYPRVRSALDEKRQTLERGWTGVNYGEVSALKREIEQLQVDVDSFREVLDDDATIDGKTREELQAELDSKREILDEFEKADRQGGFMVAELRPKRDAQGRVILDADGNQVMEMGNQQASRTGNALGRFRNLASAFDAAREVAKQNDAKVEARRRGDGGEGGIDVIPPDYDRLIDEQEGILSDLEASREVDPSLTQISARGGTKLEQKKRVEFNSDGISISAIDERILEVKREIARLKELRDGGETPEQYHMQDLQDPDDYGKALNLRDEISQIEEQLDNTDLDDDEKAELEGTLAAKRKQLDDMGDIGGLDVEFSDGGSDQALSRNVRDVDMPEFVAMDLDRIIAQNHAMSMVVTPERERIDDLDVVLSSALAAHVDAPEGEKRKLYVYAHPDGDFFYSPIHPYYYERALNPQRDDFDEKERELLDELDAIPVLTGDAVPASEKEASRAARREVIGKLVDLRDKRSAANKRRPRVLAVVDGDNHMQVFGFNNAERVDNAKFIANAAQVGRDERERDVVLNLRDNVPEGVSAFDIGLEKYVPRQASTRREVTQVANRATVRVHYSPPPDIDVELVKQEEHWQNEIERLKQKRERIEEGHHKEKTSILEGVDHELANAENQLRSIRRDIVDRKSYEDDPSRYEREQAVSSNIRDVMQQAVELQQASGKPVQVYMNGDQIEFDNKKYDSTRNRIATVTGGTGGNNPRINWKNEEMQKVHDDAEYGIKSRVKNLFFVEEVEENGRTELRLQSKAIVRNHRNAEADDNVENVRAFDPAVYRIRQNPDGTFKVLLDPEADPSGIHEEYGDYLELDAALRAVHNVEIDAIGKSGNRVFMLPEDTEFAGWSTRNGRLIASPSENLGIRGVFAISEKFYEDGDGGLFRKFEVARLVPGGNREGIERSQHDNIEDAKADVDERLRQGLVPSEAISWEEVDGMWAGKSEYDGELGRYDIFRVHGANHFVYEGNEYKTLDDAIAAAESDEAMRRQDIEDVKRGVKKVSPVEKPLPVFKPVIIEKKAISAAQANRRNEAIAGREMNTRTTKGRVGGPKGAKAQVQNGLRLTPESFFEAEREEDKAFLADLLGGLDIDEVQAVINGSRGVDVIVYDYETNAITPKGGKFYEQVPIQIGAIRIRDGKPVGEPFQVWMDPKTGLGNFANAMRPDPDNPDGPGIKVTSDWLKENGVDVADGHRQFAEWLGDEDVLMMSFNGLGFDDHIRAREFGAIGIDKPNIRGKVDALVLAKKLHTKHPDGKPENNKQEVIAKHYGVTLKNAHNAVDDAQATFGVMNALIDRARERGMNFFEMVGPRRDRPKQEMLPDERREAEIQDKMQEIASRPQSPDDDDFDVPLPGAEPPSSPSQKRETPQFDVEDLPKVLEDPSSVTGRLPRSQEVNPRMQATRTPPAGPMDFVGRILQMPSVSVVDVDGQEWTTELFRQIPTKRWKPDGEVESITIRADTFHRNNYLYNLVATSDGDGGIFVVDYQGADGHEVEGVDDDGRRKHTWVDYGYDAWVIKHVDKDGVYEEIMFKAKRATSPIIDREKGPKGLFDSPPVDWKSGKSLFQVVNEQIARNAKLREQQSNQDKLKVGEVDPRNGQKIKEIIEHDNGQIELVYEAGGRPRERANKDPNRVAQQLERLQNAKDKAEAEGDTERVESIRRAMARLETPVENAERRGEEDFVPGRGMKIGGVWRSEIPDPDSPDYINSLMEDDDGGGVGFDTEGPEVDEDDGYAMLRSMSAMSRQSRDASESAQFVRISDALDHAMNSNLTPVDNSNYSRGELNDRIRNLLVNGGNGEQIDLSDAIDFDALIDVKGAVLRKENGYVALIMTRSDGSKVGEFTKERPSPNSYFPWLQRSLAYHGNMETPKSVSPRKLKAVIDDVRYGTRTDGPAAQWTAHMGQVAHEALMQRLGITPLHNGYDGFAALRRSDPANLGFTRMGEDGVPEISLHADALFEADPAEVFLHENLHVLSPGIQSPRDVMREGLIGHEEGLVHAYTKFLLPDIQRRMGYDDITPWNPEGKDNSPYRAWGLAYEAIRRRSGLSPDQFYGKLITVHPRDREQTMRDMANQIPDTAVRRRYLDNLEADFNVLRDNPSNKYSRALPLENDAYWHPVYDDVPKSAKNSRGYGYSMPRPMAGGLPIVDAAGRGRPVAGNAFDAPVEPGEAPFMKPSIRDRNIIDSYTREEIFDRIRNDERVVDIARRYDVSTATIYKYAREAGLSVPELRPAKEMPPPKASSRKIDPDQYPVIFERVKAGESPRLIAKDYGVSESGLRNIMARFNVESQGLPRSSPRLKKLDDVADLDRVRERAVQGGTRKEIAKDLGVSLSTLKAFVDRNSIEMPDMRTSKDSERKLGGVPKLDEQQHAYVVDQVVNEGRKLADVGFELGAGPNTLTRVLKLSGYESRRVQGQGRDPLGRNWWRWVKVND